MMPATPHVQTIEVAQMAGSRFNIREGGTYEYLQSWPDGCKGARYLVRKFVKDVPSYQWKVLVECLSGPDKGTWFTVSPSNFSYRYVAVDLPQEDVADVRREVPGVQEAARS